MSDIYPQGRRLFASVVRQKLLRMLQSTLQKFPRAKLMRREGGFGVYLDANTYLYTSYSGNLTDGDMSDLLTLCTVWWRADAEYLRGIVGRRDGSSVTATELLQQYVGLTKRSVIADLLGDDVCQTCGGHGTRDGVPLAEAVSRSPASVPSIQVRGTI